MHVYHCAYLLPVCTSCIDICTLLVINWNWNWNIITQLTSFPDKYSACNVNAVSGWVFVFVVVDTHGSKVKFSASKPSFFKFWLVHGTLDILVVKYMWYYGQQILFLDIIQTNVTYILTIVFPLFRELVNVLNKNSFHTLYFPQKKYIVIRLKYKKWNLDNLILHINRIPLQRIGEGFI